MQIKLLEVRDEGTFIPMLCVDMNPTSSDPIARLYLLQRCGYPCDGRPNIAITPLGCDGEPCTNDYWAWGDRTRHIAHKHITENWGDLSDGDVIDVQFILGETSAPKKAEREESL